ncbi:MAG: GTP 3',8-cyclase MoaA [Acidobacteriota bacterium]
MYDRFNRKITYLRISVTDRCNLRCTYCMPEEGIKLKRHEDILSYEEIVRVAREAVELGIHKFRLTGGEPLVRKNIIQLVRELKKINGLKELSMTTNGVLLSLFAWELRQAGLDRLNISLDTLKPEKYRKITRVGDIENIFSGIDAALKAGFSGTKLNMVLIPGFNTDEVEKMKEFCRNKGFALQRINHYSLEERCSIQSEYQAERPLDCSQCNRIRLTADGKLKPCLFSDREIPVNMKDIGLSLKKAILAKPREGTSCFSRENWQIGG